MSAILGRPTNIFEKPYLFLFNWMFTGLHHYDNLVLHLPPSFSQGEPESLKDQQYLRQQEL
jgi:hypothetical protein